MNLMKNPELLRSVSVSTSISVVFIITAFIWDSRAGFFTLALSILLLFSPLWCSFERYKKISQLASAVDMILHGKESILPDTYAEGELEILASEIGKMTVSLREQRELLLSDKKKLSDSIADISHQIRTPLTSANLLISFLSEPGISEDRRLDCCEQLSTLVSRIDRLVTALLKISKLDAGAVEFRKDIIDLKMLVNQSCEPLIIPLELHGITLDSNCSGSFLGDIQWTSEALGNIIKNCMEHTPEGGTITVRASENPIYSEILISDTGSGISREDLPHIFERFYKGRDKDGVQGGGFGIGLSLARMIITRQNGIITAGNVPGSGALFSVKFYKGSV